MPPLTSFSTYLSELNHRHVASSASTNSELIEALQNGSLDVATAHVLTAETQSAGRGQHGRSWQSPRGNVYLSLYHPVHMPISGLLSLIIGFELAKMPVIQMLNEQLQAQGLKPIGVKWANDLGFYQQAQSQSKEQSITDSSSSVLDSVLNSDVANQRTLPFNKLAGILIEPVTKAGRLVGVVLGIGLNVQAAPKLTTQTSEGMSYQAISLQDINEMLPLEARSASLPDLPMLYQQMSKALTTAMTRFEHLGIEQTTGHTYYLDSFLEQFAMMDALSGLRLRVTQDYNNEEKVVTGIACGVDTHGCLQLRQDSGKISTLFTGRIDVIY
ncbi:MULTISPECIES: biotin--[acetyl-CoA-carboxylase] ligase [unclassified Psychrobacter]|uniref:biotin--[acetyl-CoA-carboxylase] ligase n=1 Tax=unclassified Psychrobacter TaxID=196806 RepID=UPI000C34A08C|nr:MULTISPECIES: biotin--[acetyl-CoA-carboxylase] ligase [unclassified Psychrobacter]MBA6243955.1 biotin--[acetyl-CoA-carboxylase] ligase [Psychrobacter sp. Urea-trap-18]MBA6287171.1 biotin--[acetyl-CoA-carboxylase] ligase [Psychrobacter sp. Urea-trap-16]MBA6318285.1 biotin--[acetyl-CoA-carboxylase] ligase [Psychrobacter sp. Urea-trap-20]MBA6335229.1 biotin--[acetyl-CoA-carboxylase] ligase [Psychrobacter sp. Urea-trap-19]PKG60384.1 biotin biosynthesis protein BioC [Psychrobacter sp. Choline-3u